MKYLIGRIVMGAAVCLLPLMIAASNAPAPGHTVRGKVAMSAVGSRTAVPMTPTALPPLTGREEPRAQTERQASQYPTPADSLAAARAMRARLREPDGRTSQGLGWFLGSVALLALLGGTNSSGVAVLYLVAGIALLWTGIRKYKEVTARRRQAEAAGEKPIVEVRGRVGRGVLLGFGIITALAFIVSTVYVAGARDWLSRVLLSEFSLYLLLGALLVGGILLLWRGAAYAKAMRANGFSNWRKK